MKTFRRSLSALLLSLVAGVGPVADLAGEALAVRVVVDCMVPSLANPLEAGLARARLAWLASPVAGLVPGVDPDTLAAHIRRTYQPARNIYNGLNGVISPDAILLGGMLSGGPVVQAAVVMVVSACGPGLRLADWIRAA